ncbi:MAG: J domain-containing protein [Rhodospirillales bacterium]|nr:J domain-containing protein [Rhodospirillales bacterium]
MKDPYAVLGLRRGASAEEIKASYRRLARELHPDRRPGDARAEEKFKHVSAAYALLSDSEMRKRYDRGEVDASGAPRGRRGASSPFGASSSREGAQARRHPFDRFFRDRATNAGIKVNGANVDYTLAIKFLEAARGAVKHVSMTNGKRLKVTIPPGTRAGQVLRLRGQGMPGLGGGAPGDALVEVAVQPHPVFQADGDDIRAELPVTLAEAVLGGRVEVETIDGPVVVTIPEGANTGTILRLKGKGLAKDADRRGDHYAVLKIVLPPRPDPELVEFVRAWNARRPYKVRPDVVQPADADDEN